VYVPLAIILCDKLEWERKMEEQDIHVDMKASNTLLKLVSLCGTQSGKQNSKKNWEQDILGLYECSNIYKRLVQLVMGFKVKLLMGFKVKFMMGFKVKFMIGFKVTSKGFVNETWYACV